MMSTRWNDIFQLPEAALAGNKRVPKTMLAAQAVLTKHEQKTLDKMRRLERFATATKSATRILPRVDDELDIQSVIFLRCEMADTSQAVAEVAHLLHKCFLVLVNHCDVLWSDVRRLYEERKSPDMTLNDSAKLRMRIRKAENQRDAVLTEIRGLCLPQEGESN
ncbi:MAG: hypothetical protein Q4A93_04690 [Actinomycetota bacterium]|nr:hypothetical protein [Actinomycetota bacterium]